MNYPPQGVAAIMVQYTDATLSGTPVVLAVAVEGTTKYFKAYPTKS